MACRLMASYIRARVNIKFDFAFKFICNPLQCLQAQRQQRAFRAAAEAELSARLDIQRRAECFVQPSSHQ